MGDQLEHCMPMSMNDNLERAANQSRLICAFLLCQIFSSCEACIASFSLLSGPLAQALDPCVGGCGLSFSCMPSSARRPPAPCLAAVSCGRCGGDRQLAKKPSAGLATKKCCSSSRVRGNWDDGLGWYFAKPLRDRVYTAERSSPIERLAYWVFLYKRAAWGQRGLACTHWVL